MDQEHLLENPTNPTTTVIITEQSDEQNDQEPSLKIKLIQSEEDKTKNDKKVQFTENTVDNEHLNRKKSKCCCIYEKPKIFGDPSSSSSSEDSGDEPDCCPNHCHGPKRYHKHAYHKQNGQKNDYEDKNNNV
ncbi:phosphatase 1 regulatory subunit 11-like protein [Euroglyphus maynei]|uniref:E3 ubiquitin-protein ligase PPP1R11 n=1 Tax=Euroglyphus maynei TaxID=6958 RepID=A0A1Y3BDM0_EURMA|nr:phosphatase 1 regulatory subunit 11-like protein [Euroglyphus maynei]